MRCSHHLGAWSGALLAALTILGGPERPSQFTLLYTTEVQGWTDPCG